MKIVLVKTPEGKLTPAYKGDAEIVEKLKVGIHLFQYKKSRNPMAHKLAFAIASCTLDNMPDDSFWGKAFLKNKNESPYLFIKAVMLDIGHSEIIMKSDGEVVAIPKSISFENMSDDEFQPILNELINICAKYLKITVDEFEKNYKNYL